MRRLKERDLAGLKRHEDEWLSMNWFIERCISEIELLSV